MFKFLVGTSHMYYAPDGGTEGGGTGGGSADGGGQVQTQGGSADGGQTGGQGTQAPPSPLAFASEEETAYIQSKGWDKSSNPTKDIFNSYRNLEKVFGADKAGNTIQIPGDDADAAGWDSLYNKLGRPETKDGYSEGHFTGMDEEISTELKDVGHKLGLTEKQMAGLREWNNETTSKLNAKLEEAAQMEFQQQHDALDKEWGAAKEQNLQLAKEATAKLGWNEEQIAAMQMALGYDGVMKLALNLGQAMGEGKFVSGEDGRSNTNQAMTPAQAKLELNRLTMDKDFMASWTDKAHPKHAEAVARKSQLSRWANPA